MILFLPPAPHTGEFFDSVRRRLPDLDTCAGTYPGYGGIPAGEISIEAYASSFELQDVTRIVGFHTGCLVGAEMAIRPSRIEKLLLIDIPYFNAETKEKHLAGLDHDNRNHDAFRAAFEYDVDAAFGKLACPVTCVATGSFLFDPTLRAARVIKDAMVMERREINKPVFQSDAIAALIGEWAV